MHRALIAQSNLNLDRPGGYGHLTLKVQSLTLKGQDFKVHKFSGQSFAKPAIHLVVSETAQIGCLQAKPQDGGCYWEAIKP